MNELPESRTEEPKSEDSREPSPEPGQGKKGIQINELTASQSFDVRWGEKDEMKYKQDRIDTLSVSGGIMTAIMILSSLVLAYKLFDGRYFDFNGLIQSWRRDIILDITPMKNGLCPTNYTEAISNIWPGSYEGCDCRKSKFGAEKDVELGACDSTQIMNGCLMSPNTEPRILQKWRNFKPLCIQRGKGINMEIMATNSISGTHNCRPGFMLCPPSNSMSLEGILEDYAYKMCIPESLKVCPLSGMKVFDCNSNPNILCYDEKDKIDMNGKECLWVSRRCGKGVLTLIDFGEDGICRLEQDKQISLGHSDPILLKKRRSRCLPNENVAFLDSSPQMQIYENTGVPYKSIAEMSENIEHYNFNLYMIYYTRWSWNHREEADINLIFNNRMMIEKLNEYHKTSIIFFVYYFFIFVFVSPLILKFERENPDMYSEYKILFLLKPTVKWLFRIGAVLVIYVMIGYNKAIWIKFRSYVHGNLSSPFENNKIDEISLGLESGIYIFDNMALYSAYSSIGIEISCLFMSWRNRRRSDRDTVLTQGDTILNNVQPRTEIIDSERNSPT